MPPWFDGLGVGVDRVQQFGRRSSTSTLSSASLVRFSTSRVYWNSAFFWTSRGMDLVSSSALVDSLPVGMACFVVR
ncbi:MAG: hypothetical protein R3F17_05265 [Planctomycetota bacterium]